MRIEYLLKYRIDFNRTDWYDRKDSMGEEWTKEFDSEYEAWQWIREIANRAEEGLIRQGHTGLVKTSTCKPIAEIIT